MLINRRELLELSENVRRAIDGQVVDFRDNSEGAMGLLKNDIHTLTSLKNEQASSFQRERNQMADTLANISHQLKTPLTSMTIMADLIENAPPEKQAEFVANIKIGLTRMDWLVSALLKMARLDAGAIVFAKETVRSAALVELALEPLQILLDVKNQRVECVGETELLCDRRWTAEALMNVIKNASEHSPEGAEVRIEVGENPICRWVSVTDSGSGITSGETARIFSRFDSSRGGNGYGIGLPLALAVMRRQNGDIDVDGGGNGHGATFTLKLFR